MSETNCASREARYVPWSWGEVFECLTCALQVRQDHLLRPLRGEGYAAVYPMPPHETRPREVCAPCAIDAHDICSKRRDRRLLCDCETCATRVVDASETA